MKGSQPKTQTTTQKQEPWAAIQPDILNAVAGMQLTYNQPRTYFPGSTVVPFSGQTTDALQGVEARARAGSPVTAAMQGQVQDTLQGDYLGAGPGNGMFRSIGRDADAARRLSSNSDPSNQLLMQIMRGGGNPAAGIYSSVANDPGSMEGSDVMRRFTGGALSGERTAANDMAAEGFDDPSSGFYRTQAGGGMVNGDTGALRDIANGGTNPQLDAMFDKIAGKIGASVDRNAALDGRTGSATHQRLLQEGIGDAANDFYGQAYESDANRRLTAGGQLAQLGESALDRRTQGAQALTASGQFGTQQKLSALGLAGSLGGQDADISMRAGQGLDTAANNRTATRLAGASGLASTWGDDQNRRITAASGLTGNKTSALSLAGNLSGTAGSGLNSAWDAERGRQVQSMLFAPQAAAADYSDLDRLLGVGGEYEAQGGRDLQDQLDRYNFNMNDPYDRSQQLLNAMLGAGNAGGTTTKTEPLYRQGGGLGGMIGGASAGAGLLSQILPSAGPWGLGAAALLGAVGGR